MELTADLKAALIRQVAEAVISHADELTALDQAIGDGDHGVNLKRGFEAVLAQLTTLAEKDPGEILKAVGTALVMKVGGASGPLYGTLFMTMGKHLPPKFSLSDLAQAFTAGVEAVKVRGKSDVGQKTMLDVLVPVARTLQESNDDLLSKLKTVAESSAHATIPMKAVRGRASFLGERSVGHMDPGARSSSLMVLAVVETLENHR